MSARFRYNVTSLVESDLFRQSADEYLPHQRESDCPPKPTVTRVIGQKQNPTYWGGSNDLIERYLLNPLRA